MKKFRAWSEKFSLKFYDDLFTADEDAENAFRKHPYSWMYLLIPIAGLVFFYGVVWEENIARRRRELEIRKKKLERSPNGMAVDC